MPARRERRFIADPESMKRVVALLLAPVVFQLALALVPPRAARSCRAAAVAEEEQLPPRAERLGDQVDGALERIAVLLQEDLAGARARLEQRPDGLRRRACWTRASAKY